MPSPCSLLLNDKVAWSPFFKNIYFSPLREDETAGSTPAVLRRSLPQSPLNIGSYWGINPPDPLLLRENENVESTPTTLCNLSFRFQA